MSLYVHADCMTVDQCQLVLFSLFCICMLVAFTLLRWVITSFFSCGPALVVELLCVLLCCYSSVVHLAASTLARPANWADL